MKKFYITTPIYYPSDNLHIGHTYTTVAADVIARYKRMRGFDVMFLTGTDEHGQKIQKKAEAAGVSPQEYVDKVVDGIKKLWKLMNISNDRFIRTTDQQHVKAVQNIFDKLYEKGDIYKDEYEGYYCTPCESFWTEHQLINGNCPDCGRAAQKTKEESYFFRISKYQDRIIDLIENTDFLEPASRRNEMLNNFLRPGLKDISVSRTSFDWGVPVPFDDKHVVYVWLDALSNYITALGAFSDNDEDFKNYWPADVHLMAKEIVRFHSIIWPGILMALDIPLPKKIYGHGWLLLDGGKMSKSKGNIVDPVVLAGKYGVDALRFFVLREMPFGMDSEFSNEALINRINSDLANDLGNLVSRTEAMIEKYFGGTLPDNRVSGDFDADLKALTASTVKKVEEGLDNMQFSVVLSDIWALISRNNKYIDETMPWLLAKNEENMPRLAEVMYNLSESLRHISIMLSPFMPDTSAKILADFGVSKDDTMWTSLEFGTKESYSVKKGEVLFPRIDVKKELEELENMSAKPKIEVMPEIEYDDFKKLDLRMAEIKSVFEVDGADKLYKLTLDVGGEEKIVVSGIKAFYKPEDLKGKKVLYLQNLKPRKLRGIMSEGMILAAEDEKEGISLLTTLKDMPSGSKIG